MTTIESVEQLVGLQSGQVVTIGDNSNMWVRNETGFAREGFTLTPENFVGEVQARRVTLGVRPAVGQVWFEQYGYHHIVLTENGDGTFWCSRHTESGVFRRIIKLTANIPGQVVTEPPAWVEQARLMGSALAEREQTVERLNTALTQEREAARRERDRVYTEHEAWKERLRAGLHEWMGENDHGHRSPLADLIVRLGVPRPPAPRVEVEVTVNVSATTAVTVERDTVAGSMPGVEVTSDPVVTSSWRTEVKVTKTVDEGACACGTVSRAEVRDALRAAGVADTLVDQHFAYHSTCPNHNAAF